MLRILSLPHLQYHSKEEEEEEEEEEEPLISTTLLISLQLIPLKQCHRQRVGSLLKLERRRFSNA